METQSTEEHAPREGAAGDGAVSLTEKAQGQVLRLLEKEGMTDTHHLRVKVVGGGCSGLSYQLAFDDKIEDDDIVHEYPKFKVLVGPDAKEYLNGTVVDFVEAFGGGGFQFRNPNAESTCGCGSSFSVSAAEAES